MAVDWDVHSFTSSPRQAVILNHASYLAVEETWKKNGNKNGGVKELHLEDCLT